MSALDKLKAEAAAQEAVARASGRPIKHCSALALVAKSHGYRNWRACRAALSAMVPDSMGATRKKPQMADVDMKHYRSRDWNFSLDIPRHWNAFPAVSANSPYEVIRFASHEDGTHVLIIFRTPWSPRNGSQAYTERWQNDLAQAGFGKFVISETAIGSRQVLVLDCNRPMNGANWNMALDGETWTVREYFVFDGTLVYALGFGTNRGHEKIDVYEQISGSFEIWEDPYSA